MPANISTNSEIFRSMGFWFECVERHLFKASCMAAKFGCPECISADRREFLDKLSESIRIHPSSDSSSEALGKYTPNDKLKWQCVAHPEQEWSSSFPNVARYFENPYRMCDKCCLEKANTATLRPDLLTVWHPTKNDTSLDKLTIHDTRKFWWHCEKDHEWEIGFTDAKGRKRSVVCPECKATEKHQNKLSTQHPEVLEWLHPTKNTMSAESIGNQSSISKRKVWLKCPKGDDHEWQTTIKKTASSPVKCGFCSGSEWSISTQSLQGVRPDLVSDLDTKRSFEGKEVPTPELLDAYSEDVIFWKCAENHSYVCSVVDRVKNGQDCVQCTKSSFYHTHPELAAQWHPTDNKANGLTPLNITAHFDQPAFWSCNADFDHIWEESVLHRTQAFDEHGVNSSEVQCPYCVGLAPSRTNNFRSLFRGISTKWHPTLNGDLRPENVLCSDRNKYWFLEDEKEFLASPAQLTVPQSLAGPRYARARELYLPEKTGLAAENVDALSSSYSVWWRCAKRPEHIFKKKPRIVINAVNRINAFICDPCPHCVEERRKAVLPPDMRSIADAYPPLAAQFHLERNAPLTPQDYLMCSRERVWWKCPVADDHVWMCTGRHRLRGRIKNPAIVEKQKSESSGAEEVVAKPVEEMDPAKIMQPCPFCTGYRVCESNSIQNVSPDLLKEWHPTKNILITPSMLNAQSNISVWWQCPKYKDHEFVSSVSRRLATGRRRKDCPFCADKEVSKQNNLAVVAPDIAELWFLERNCEIATKRVLASSMHYFWWKCPAAPDHEWYDRCKNVVDKGRENACPFCTNRRVCTANSLKTLAPELVKDNWHFKANDPLKPSDIMATSRRIVYWRCKKPAHRDLQPWQARVASVYEGKTQCPYCMCAMRMERSERVRQQRLAQRVERQNRIRKETEKRLKESEDYRQQWTK
eukprot:718736_1